MIDPAFDGHQARNFATMTPRERLDDLSRKIALVRMNSAAPAPLWKPEKLRRSRMIEACEAPRCRARQVQIDNSGGANAEKPRIVAVAGAKKQESPALLPGFPFRERDKRLEPSTFSMARRRSTN